MSEWTEEKKLWIWRSGVILDEGMVSDLVSGVLWPEPCRRWVRWTEEKKLWIWRSGVILDEGMVSDLVSGIIGENVELLNWQMEVSKSIK